ncbi:hypothetical protein ACLB2K_022102 [Fragaria x ananassa]
MARIRSIILAGKSSDKRGMFQRPGVMKRSETIDTLPHELTGEDLEALRDQHLGLESPSAFLERRPSWQRDRRCSNGYTASTPQIRHLSVMISCSSFAKAVNDNLDNDDDKPLWRCLVRFRRSRN